MENADVGSSNTIWDLLIDDFWGQRLNSSHSHGSYRPLTVLTYRLTYKLVGFNGVYYHLTNVLLHCVATSLVVLLGRQLLTNDTCIFISGALFAVHPVHCEAVCGLVGRADVCCCIFFLIGLLCYINYANDYCSFASAEDKVVGFCWMSCWLLVATVTCAAAAFFSKEYGISLIPICIIYDVIKYRLQIYHLWQVIKFLSLIPPTDLLNRAVVFNAIEAKANLMLKE